jgi:hypothetical protein
MATSDRVSVSKVKLEELKELLKELQEQLRERP